MNNINSTTLVCEILAPRAAQAGALAEIAGTVARDLGMTLLPKTLVIGRSAREATLTLHLPTELAATQNEVWCLVCRLACFCPNARVGVLVLSGEEFTPRPTLADLEARRPA